MLPGIKKTKSLQHRPNVHNTTHVSASDLIYQSVGFSCGWITATPMDSLDGYLHQTVRWAESQFESISNTSYERPIVHMTDTLRAIETARQQAFPLFTSEGIHARFGVESTKQVQRILGLQRKDRLVNALPLDIMDSNTKSLYLLQILSKANANRTRSMKLSDLMRLAIHSKASIADFYPDSHIMISNLAAFMVRFHLQPDARFPEGIDTSDPQSEPLPTLQNTWDSLRSRYPRVSPRDLEQLTEERLSRHLLMFLYGLLVLKHGELVPVAPVRDQDIHDRIRSLFQQGFTVWPLRLSESLNKSWSQKHDREFTVEHYAEDIALLARRLGRSLLGQDPLVCELLG
jgi:hypothetical protein